MGIWSKKSMSAMRRPVRSLPCVQWVMMGAFLGLENSLSA
jgi:hypothetical protein